MKKYSILFFWIINIHCLYAQEIYKEGYVITNEKDTLYGQIKFLGPEKNSEECHYIPKSSSKTFIYTPADVFGYKFENGSYYISKKFTIDQVVYFQFVELLVDGITDLYRIYYNKNIQYFLVKNDTTSIFINTQRAAIQNEENIKEENTQDKLNKGKLKYLMQDYPLIFTKIDNLDYQEKSMVKIITDYHNGVCNDYECIDYTKRNIRPNIYLGILFGIKSSSIKFEGDDHFYYLTEAGVQWNISMVYGISFGMNMPKTNERIAIDFQFSNFSEDFRFDYNGGIDISRFDEIVDEASPLDPEISSALMSYNFFSAGLNLNYLLIDKKIKIKPLVGLELGTLWDVEYTMYNSHLSFGLNQDLSFDFKESSLLAFNAGLIFEYDITHNLSIQIKSEITHTLSSIDDYLSLNNKYNIFKETVRLIRYF